MPSESLSVLLPAVAEAVLSYALEKLDPADRVREWLKRDPARLAYQKALARAYAAFARQYPDLTASLFDELFLKTKAVPELAKQLTRHQHPDPAQLAQLWAESLPGSASQRHAAHIARAAADFLHWLESELKAEQVLQPLFDSRALESLPALEAKFDALAAELRRALDAALEQAKGYGKTISQSGDINLDAGGDIIIGGDVVGRDKITNIAYVYNSYFSGDFATLDELYIRPDAVFQRVRADEFVGREWLTAKVDEFLNSRPSGAFVLVGEAGVGKTAFLVHLVRERRYLHLFAEQVPGDANLKRALQSLGAQVVTRYQLEDYTRRDTLPAIAEFPDFLERLLRLAAGKLAAGEKIVIACDALDEAGTAPNGNVFGLPAVLPEGVYLLLARRPLPVKLHFKEFAPLEETLEPASAENRRDLEDYLTAVARRPEIASGLTI